MTNVIIDNWFWNKILGTKNKHIGRFVRTYLIYSMKIKPKIKKNTLQTQNL